MTPYLELGEIFVWVLYMVIDYRHYKNKAAIVIEKREKSKIILSPKAKSLGVFIDISNKNQTKYLQK
jgi:hypothetical protein